MGLIDPFLFLGEARTCFEDLGRRALITAIHIRLSLETPKRLICRVFIRYFAFGDRHLNGLIRQARR